MSIQTIADLLAEAATCDDWKRANAIQIELGGELHERRTSIFNQLFVRLWQNDRLRLLTLIPLLEVWMGGERDA